MKIDWQYSENYGQISWQDECLKLQVILYNVCVESIRTFGRKSRKTKNKDGEKEIIMIRNVMYKLLKPLVSAVNDERLIANQKNI